MVVISVHVVDPIEGDPRASILGPDARRSSPADDLAAASVLPGNGVQYLKWCAWDARYAVHGPSARLSRAWEYDISTDVNGQGWDVPEVVNSIRKSW